MKVPALSPFLNKTAAGSDFIIPLISTGTGAGVSTISFQVFAASTMSISGTGRFYDNSGGTTNEGTTRTISPGAVRTFYLKLPSGSSTITISNGNANLQYFNSWTSGTNAASIYQLDMLWLPRVLQRFVCIGNNTCKGSIADLPPTLTEIYINGTHTLSGTLSSIRSTVINFTVTSSINCTITGSIADLPPNLATFGLSPYGATPITGDLSDIRATCTSFSLSGNSSVSGNLSSLRPGMTIFMCTGATNTVTGNLSSVPSTIQYLWVTGNNTITGDRASLPANIVGVLLGSSTRVSDYTSGKNWSDALNSFQFNGAVGYGLSATEVDNLLIDLDSTSPWSGTGKLLQLQGSHAPRTSASNAAVLSLQAKGVTVSTN
jgi:hypothetical protein